MRDFIMQHRIGIATIVTALVVAAFSIYTVPLNPPLGDCFGGALSQDPLHCYALEQANSQGVIDVEKVYDTDGVLYFSLRQDGDVADNVYDFIRAKSSEFYDRWPDDVPVLSYYDGCLEHLKPTYRECYLEVGLNRMYLPKSMEHNDIRFYTGDETARRLELGWASWRQVWPAVAGGASGSSETPTTFDVSDVDIPSFQPFACPKVLTEDMLCSRYPEVRGVAGLHWGEEKMYVQVKRPPRNEADLQAFRQALVPCYDKVGVCTYTATTTVPHIVDGVETYTETTTRITVYNESATPSENIVIIPVKYSWDELEHWAEILNRFATSRGNTIGIMLTVVASNRWGSSSAIWPMDNLGPARKGWIGYDPASIRETIVVTGFNARRIANALPTLLPLLGIPVDAVGIIDTQPRRGSTYAVLDVLPDRGTAPSPPVRFASAVGVPMPLLLLARNVGAVLVIGGVAALVLRLRRRRAPG